MENAQLQTIKDNDHIMMLTQSSDTPPTAETNYAIPELQYMFIICKTRKDFGAAKGRVKGYSILTDTCTPAYRGIDNTPFILKPGSVSEAEKAAAINTLTVNSFRTQKRQGRMYIGAFSFGATLGGGFMKPVIQAFRGIVPKALQRPRLHGFSAAVAEFAVGVSPPVITAEDEFFEPAFKDFSRFAFGEEVDVDEYRQLYPINPLKHKIADYTLSAGAGVAGAATARVLITKVQAASASNPVTGVIAFVAIPFIASAIIWSMEDHDEDVLKNFSSLLEVNTPQNSLANASHVSSVPKAAEAMGKVFLETRWTNYDLLRRYCIPGDDKDNPICQDISYNKEYAHKIAGEDSIPNICSLYPNPSPYPEDAPLHLFEAYIHCEFSKPGTNCVEKYGCGLKPISEESCVKMGEVIQDRTEQVLSTMRHQNTAKARGEAVDNPIKFQHANFTTADITKRCRTWK